MWPSVNRDRCTPCRARRHRPSVQRARVVLGGSCPLRGSCVLFGGPETHCWVPGPVFAHLVRAPSHAHKELWLPTSLQRQCECGSCAGPRARVCTSQRARMPPPQLGHRGLNSSGLIMRRPLLTFLYHFCHSISAAPHHWYFYSQFEGGETSARATSCLEAQHEQAVKSGFEPSSHTPEPLRSCRVGAPWSGPMWPEFL